MTVTIHTGDAATVLATLPEKSVHTVVTSPPYWGLRDYGTGQWQGGDAGCNHIRPKRGKASTIDGGHYQSREIYRDVCGRCGATRHDQQIGLEPSPALYVAGLVEVFRAVRRVLRDDGTVWLNLGDSYAGSWGAESHRETDAQPGWRNSISNHPKHPRATGSFRDIGLKPKDLVGIPWRVAFALQADGWWLRQEIIWAKPNPMPESVTDRCTKAHESLFLLSKSETYYFDAAAIAEPVASLEHPRNVDSPTVSMMPGASPHKGLHRKGWSARRGRKAGNKSHKYVSAYEAAATEEHRIKSGLMKIADVEWTKRNKRSVWTVATQPYKGAHFATFPPALIEPCILAGAPAGGMVLDPFGGAGTVALVADRHGRDATLIDLNPAYVAMAQERVAADARLLAKVAAQ